MVVKTAKKIIALLLLTVIIISFTACKSKNSDVETTEGNVGIETLAEGETYPEIDIPQNLMGLSKALKEVDSKIESAIDNSKYIQKYYDKNTISSAYNYANNMDASTGSRYEVTLVTKSYDYILKDEYAEKVYEDRLKYLEGTTEAQEETEVTSESSSEGSSEVSEQEPEQESSTSSAEQPQFDELDESSQLSLLSDVRANAYVYMKPSGDIDRVDIVYNYLDAIEGMQDEAKVFLGDVVTNLFGADVSKVVDEMWDSQNVTIPSDDGDITVIKTISTFEGVNVVSVAFNRVNTDADSESVNIMDKEIAPGYNLTDITSVSDFMDKVGANIGTGESYISSMYESNNNYYKDGESQDFSMDIYVVAPKLSQKGENDVSFAELMVQKLMGTQESHMAIFEVCDGNFVTFDEAMENSKAILKDVFGYEISEEYDNYSGYNFSDEKVTISCYIQELGGSELSIPVESVEGDEETQDGEIQETQSEDSAGNIDESKPYYLYDLQVNVREN